MSENALVQVNQLKMYFPTRAGSFLNRTTGYIKAVDGISLEIRKGETLGLFGEAAAARALPDARSCSSIGPQAGR